jgi:hypothetical protein
MKTLTIRPTLCAAGVALILSGAVPAIAGANNRNNGNVASGNSAVSQYVESFPTAGGGKRTDRIGPHGRHSGRGPLSSSTQRALAQSGQSGQDAAAFADATAPSSSGAGAATGSGSSLAGTAGAAGAAGTSRAGTAHPGAAGGAGTAGSQSGGSVAARVGAVAGATSDGSSPLKSVLTAFTGGSTTGGLGPWLPVLLIVVLLGGCALGLRNRMRRGST